MKLATAINAHKGSTFVVVLLLQYLFKNYTTTGYVYLALHGSYGICWLLKDYYYPDAQWQRRVDFTEAFTAFSAVNLYWLAPYLLLKNKAQPEASKFMICTVMVMYIIGFFFHFVSDAQKYYTLKLHQGLITTGLFASTRNPNYFGEVLIYLSFALLSGHYVPFLVLAFFIFAVFIPNMLKKDKSLARYPEFQSYYERTSLLIPKFW